jgi:phosphomannomutase
MPDVPLAVTPMHGVGGGPVERILQARGHHVVRVAGQWAPDGAFPSVEFPNPEEPGALDLAEATATDTGAAVILANAPDADRLAVAIPVVGGWRRLSGDEVGSIFAHHLLAHGGADRDRPLVANSIVSSARLGRIAAAFGARHEVTLTGFKWLWRAGRELAADGWDWVMGYEEALGYSLGDAVRDKDGINAAAVMADLVVDLARQGRGLADLLADLDDRYGRWANIQESVRRTGPQGAEEILAAVDAATTVDPGAPGVRTIDRVVDHRREDPDAPAWRPTTPLVVWHLVGGGRVLVRPSGTEPKLKVYVDLVADPGTAPELRRSELVAEAEAIAAATSDLLNFD